MSDVWLPHVLYEIEAAFGQAVMLAFAAEFGGGKISIPARPAPEHRIAQAFGLPLLEWLVERWGGTALLVPLGPQSSHGKLVRETRRLLQAGEDAATIRRLVGCHQRTIHRHRAALRDDEARMQGDLFGKKTP